MFRQVADSTAHVCAFAGVETGRVGIGGDDLGQKRVFAGCGAVHARFEAVNVYGHTEGLDDSFKHVFVPPCPSVEEEDGIWWVEAEEGDHVAHRILLGRHGLFEVQLLGVEVDVFKSEWKTGKGVESLLCVAGGLGFRVETVLLGGRRLRVRVLVVSDVGCHGRVAYEGIAPPHFCPQVTGMEYGTARSLDEKHSGAKHVVGLYEGEGELGTGAVGDLCGRVVGQGVE